MATGALLVAGPAVAQDAGADGPSVPDCASLSNPLFLTGSSAFEATVKNFAVRFSALATNPFTVVYHLPGSCFGVDNITNNKDLTGTAHYYTLNGTTVVTNTCALAASGQKADLGISDVFYESCTITPATKPTTLGDFVGPVQAMLFVVPKANTTDKYITALEAQDLYGCGASFTSNMTRWMDPLGNFCRDPLSGTQVTVAKNINVPAGAMISPACNATVGTGGMLNAVTTYASPQAAIGFVSEDAYDGARATLNSLAFQAFGQTYAFYSDSNAATSDRANVRDGHYLIWGYEHMLAPVGTGTTPTNPRVADFVGFINGTKTDASIDPVTIEGKAGTIPLCGMKVKRTTDGGILSLATDNTDPCGCAFEAAVTNSTPSQCQACTGTGTSSCTGGKTCHHGFCE
jgi:hypothetical protein